MVKTLILCADDYALNPAISQGILNLVAQQRLSATSCMVTSNYWPEHAGWLKPYIGQIDIGLHFNLTEGMPLGEMQRLAPSGHFPTLSKLLIGSHLGRLSYDEIYAELERQLQQFERALGRLPDFIDGHQHIHCLPIIRRALLDYYKKYLGDKKIWLRNICPSRLDQLLSSPSLIKQLILLAVGGRSFKKQLQKQQLPHNKCFSGIYAFEQQQAYKDLFQIFLATADNGSLVMCHPGLSSHDLGDAICKNRLQEYEYFASDNFVAQCAQYNFKLSRFTPL